ncbi:hypothetical protein SEA_PICKLES13_66 [Microbacterium phage Pickles13]|nr:hypothetical protein SEA_PICKLES13_66 [Microbacterium phage Pickles13]
MRTSFMTRDAVRLWVPKMRRADDRTLAVYAMYASFVFGAHEARIIERVAQSEMRRRSK